MAKASSPLRSPFLLVPIGLLAAYLLLPGDPVGPTPSAAVGADGPSVSPRASAVTRPGPRLRRSPETPDGHDLVIVLGRAEPAVRLDGETF